MYAVISLTEIFPLESTSTVLKALVSPASLLSMFSPKTDWKAAVAPRVFSVWLSPAWPSSLALLATALVWSTVAATPVLTAPVVALVVDLVTSTVALVAPPTQFFTDSMMFAIERRFVNAAQGPSDEYIMFVWQNTAPTPQPCTLAGHRLPKTRRAP